MGVQEKHLDELRRLSALDLSVLLCDATQTVVEVNCEDRSRSRFVLHHGILLQILPRLKSHTLGSLQVASKRLGREFEVCKE